MKRLSVLILAAIVALPLFIQSCADGGDGPATSVDQQFVTFVRNISNNSVEFQYTTVNDGRLVTLTANGQGYIDTAMARPGQRVFLTYTINNGGLPGYDADINVLGITKVHQDTVTAAPLDSITTTDPYRVLTLVRSGNYINMVATVANCEKRQWNIYVDEATEQNSDPEVYITTSVVKQGAVPDYTVNSYCSFDISPLWMRPGVRSITIHVDTQNNSTSSTTISKN